MKVALHTELNPDLLIHTYCHNCFTGVDQWAKALKEEKKQGDIKYYPASVQGDLHPYFF